jgi:hypothetical protein
MYVGMYLSNLLLGEAIKAPVSPILIQSGQRARQQTSEPLIILLLKCRLHNQALLIFLVWLNLMFNKLNRYVVRVLGDIQ